MRHWSLYHPRVMRWTDPIDHHVAGIERQLKPYTSPHHLTVKAQKQQVGDTHTTYNRTWKIEQVRLDQSMDRGGTPRRERTVTNPGVASTTTPRAKIAYELHPNCAATWPDTEAPHTPYASPMR